MPSAPLEDGEESRCLGRTTPAPSRKEALALVEEEHGVVRLCLAKERQQVRHAAVVLVY